jgi:hypothetical protein
MSEAKFPKRLQLNACFGNERSEIPETATAKMPVSGMSEAKFPKRLQNACFGNERSEIPETATAKCLFRE